jgi:stage V sporulation protein D (sporulation-specific penicillin-binding protein)
VSLAPAEDPKIAVLVLVDDPTAGSHFGSAVAAPVVANILSETLPHLGISPNTDKDTTVAVSDYRNQAISTAKQKIEKLGLKCVVRGNGEKVTEQLPAAGTVITSDGVIILYTEGATPEVSAKVPNVLNNSPSTAIKAVLNSNLNVSINGIFNNDFTNCRVVSQSIKGGEKVLPGTVIELEFLYEEAIE